MNYQDCIREIPDFPKKGILFKDITPIFKNPEAFHNLIEDLYNKVKELDFDYIAGIEARGFLVGVPLALKMNKGFIPIRKKGKLPGEVIRAEYELEYGSNTLEMHKDAFEPGSKILIIDDLLATGGTVSASIEMIENLNGQVAGLAFILELTFLNGRERLSKFPVISLIKD
ncbi:adenine phosphoribosyltransferase [Anoxybacter fermentans]|uniref:Adenine phosphoribosyltransferase n=1 Tax=Anoxybacter fermentans TaxID=1323375 RepID=A0A3S9SXX2_9FIRM|nr:adenine phosphoribosyltransferase [Anoxybacter fermentans]AZR73092.1 adenine phosphoribosyltransferase [Anoxybacter fermentans]